MPGFNQPPSEASSTLDVWIAVSEIARNWGLVVAAGAAGTFGLWLAWRRTSAATLQADVAGARQVTEAFTAAIGQLGYDKNDLEVRLGAIYALGELAKTAPSLHWPIMETLCAYVREHTRPQLEFGEDASAPAGAESEPFELKPDIEAVVGVLCGRVVGQDPPDQRLDLSGSVFPGALMHGVNLRGANLRLIGWVAVDLRGADLSGADLRGADLSKANLHGTNLSGATLRSANLSGASLRDARFHRTTMPEGGTHTGTGPPPGLNSAD